MDRTDHQIVDLLQKNARASLKDIAKETYLSSPAISSRISRLEEEGVLKEYQAKVDYTKVGFFIKAFINLSISPNQKPDFYPFIAKCPNVIQCDCVTGDYSMLIQVAFPTTTTLDAFINEIQQFGPTSTQIVFSTPVENRGIPLLETME